MSHTKQERWTCDAPKCREFTDKDPVGLSLYFLSRDGWRYVLGLFICPKHTVAVLIDGIAKNGKGGE